MLGLPNAIRACLFDLDGVLTQTAKIHAAAWKEMFDAFLRERAAQTGESFEPFDPVADYDEYVDGKPRYDGVRSFLAARGIALPEGTPDDPPDAATVHGLGNRKNELVLAMIERQGVQVYEGSVRYVRAVRDAGLGRGRHIERERRRGARSSRNRRPVRRSHRRGRRGAGAPRGQAGTGHVPRRGACAGGRA